MFQDHQAEWLDGLPKVQGSRWAQLENFSKGLLEGMRVGTPQPQLVVGQLFDLIDLRHLQVLSENNVRSPSDLHTFLALPCLSRLVSLDLGSYRMGDMGAQAVAESPHLAPLELLGLSSNYLGPAGARAVAESPHLAALTSLNLGDNRIGDAGAQALAESPQSPIHPIWPP
jgi:hypothetical protein